MLLWTVDTCDDTNLYCFRDLELDRADSFCTQLKANHCRCQISEDLILIHFSCRLQWRQKEAMHVDFQFTESGVVNVFLQEKSTISRLLVVYIWSSVNNYNNNYCSQV